VCFEMDFGGGGAAPTRTTEMAKEGVSDVALRRDERLFVTAGWDGRLRVYSCKKGACIAILKVCPRLAAVALWSTDILHFHKQN